MITKLFSIVSPISFQTREIQSIADNAPILTPQICVESICYDGRVEKPWNIAAGHRIISSNQGPSYFLGKKLKVLYHSVGYSIVLAPSLLRALSLGLDPLVGPCD